MSSAENDTRTLAQVESDRVRSAAEKEGKGQGLKLSKDGKCMVCDKDSVAITCSKECQGIWKVAEPYTKMGFTKSKAIELVASMGLGKVQWKSLKYLHYFLLRQEVK